MKESKRRLGPATVKLAEHLCGAKVCVYALNSQFITSVCDFHYLYYFFLRYGNMSLIISKYRDITSLGCIQEVRVYTFRHSKPQPSADTNEKCEEKIENVFLNLHSDWRSMPHTLLAFTLSSVQVMKTESGSLSLSLVLGLLFWRFLRRFQFWYGRWQWPWRIYREAHSLNEGSRRFF